jgi:hypothetical protein
LSLQALKLSKTELKDEIMSNDLRRSSVKFFERKRIQIGWESNVGG